MRTTFVKRATLMVAVLGYQAGSAAQPKPAAWLDDPKPTSWNKPGLPIPSAPKVEEAVDPRCREQARPAQLAEDRLVRGRGWELIGAFEGGWDTVVIRATAGYDGMCRPRPYQAFVFVRGKFAGTLSPQPMESRADGALDRIFLEDRNRLTAQYRRYLPTDALCCPSRTTSVEFAISSAPALATPASASTFK